MTLTRCKIAGVLTALLLPMTQPVKAQTSGQTGFEQSTAILDTAVLFAIGAQEADQALRGSFGWPTFQEGFVEGVYFRFDPDGYARFSPSPRLDEDVFEVICAQASTACIAKKGILEIGLTPAGQTQIRLNGITPDDSFYVSDRKSELPLPPSVLEPLAPRLEALLSGGGELIIKREVEVVQSVSLAGFSAVATYLRWVAQRQSPRVFPRGWPVPAQSQNQTFSGLTQPNQWESPSAGPQTVETTWHIQQKLRKNGNLALDARAREQSPSNQQLGTANNQVGELQQQIFQLQNNLLQMQQGAGNNRFTNTSSSGLSTSRYQAEDLQEYGQAFAQQAQGRSLPASPGGLGVGGDSLSAERPNTRAASAINQFTFPQAQQPRKEWSASPQADQTHLVRRIESLETSLLELRRDLSLQVFELREELFTRTRTQAQAVFPAIERPKTPIGPIPLRTTQSRQQQTSATVLEELEKTLMARLNAQNQLPELQQPAATLPIDNAAVNRQLIEEIINELGGETGLRGPTTSSIESIPAEPAETSSDFVTLNDYINQVLRTEGQQTPAPGR